MAETGAASPLTAPAERAAVATWACDLTGLEGCRWLADWVAATARPGQVIGLDGPLGAGKTAFVGALAAAWGVADLGEVLSPSYALMHEYPAERGPLVHLDLWRAAEAAAQAALGLEEALDRQDALVVVEWARLAAGGMPPGAWRLDWRPLPSGQRQVRLWGPPAPPAGALGPGAEWAAAAPGEGGAG